MPWWSVLAVAALALPAGAQTVGDIVAAVRAGRSDSSVAKALHKMKPTEQLDDSVVEELESEGAGPKTVSELERLAGISRDLPEANPAPVFPHPPAPSAAERRRILEAARRVALGYTHSLPDFICMEKVRRFEGPRGDWELKDTLEVKLSYFEQQEEYQLISRNGRPSTLAYREVGGALTEGEFGSTLAAVFHPDSGTEFRWVHWTTLRGRAAHVFTFRIAVEHATYRMEFGRRAGEREGSVITGQHGTVYVDAETGQAVRIVAESDSIPPDFPVRSSTTALDYGFVDVGDRHYLLPLRAEVRMATDILRIRSLVEFHGYRKFAGQSTITFH
jgi:hypothetical protein